MKTVPDNGDWTFDIVRKRVDFPMPFLPNSAINFPFSNDKFIASAIIVFDFFC